MAKPDEPKVTKLVFGEGDNAVTVSVAEDQAETLMAGGQFKKATTSNKTSK